MDRGDALDAYELLPRRLQRLIARAFAVVLMTAGIVAPTLHVPERAMGWLAEAYTQRFEDMFARLLDNIGALTPEAGYPASNQ